MKGRQRGLTLKNNEGEGGCEDEAEAGGGRESREVAARGVGVEKVGYKGDLAVKSVLGLGGGVDVGVGSGVRDEREG